MFHRVEINPFDVPLYKWDCKPKLEENYLYDCFISLWKGDLLEIPCSRIAISLRRRPAPLALSVAHTPIIDVNVKDILEQDCKEDLSFTPVSVRDKKSSTKMDSGFLVSMHASVDVHYTGPVYSMDCKYPGGIRREYLLKGLHVETDSQNSVTLARTERFSASVMICNLIVVGHLKNIHKAVEVTPVLDVITSFRKLELASDLTNQSLAVTPKDVIHLGPAPFEHTPTLPENKAIILEIIKSRSE